MGERIIKKQFQLRVVTWLLFHRLVYYHICWLLCVDYSAPGDDMKYNFLQKAAVTTNKYSKFGFLTHALSSVITLVIYLEETCGLYDPCFNYRHMENPKWISQVIYNVPCAEQKAPHNEELLRDELIDKMILQILYDSVSIQDNRGILPIVAVSDDTNRPPVFTLSL